MGSDYAGRMFDRRRFLQGLSAAAVSAALPLRAYAKSAAYPFTLGIAAGYPAPGALVLWTRLAPEPQAPGGGMAREVVPVAWEIARDEGMKKLEASGTAYATPDWAHSVHVEVGGLKPERSYWYRFRAGDAQSAIGHARTAPGRTSHPRQLRLAVASCQQYEQGYYGAYRHIAADRPDAVLHLGDYIYESSWGRDHVRKHGNPEPVTLEDYRIRYALYKSDPDLQAAHAATAWSFTWDDHEVQNDYANDRSQFLDAREWFLARRAAAYKARYEHLPLPRAMVPAGPYARIYTKLAFGSLVNVFMLDDRQYRSSQACSRKGRGGSNTVDVADCAELADPARTLLGAAQESWLEAQLAASRARWNLVAQQTMMAQYDQQPGPGRRAWNDAWDGYPAARERLLDAAAQAANPVILGGDVHAFHVNDLKRDFGDPNSPVMASEFVGTSITSQGRSQKRIAAAMADNPHMKFADSRYRGYLRLELTPDRLSADLRAMESVQSGDARCNTLATFVVENGRPGPLRA